MGVNEYLLMYPRVSIVVIASLLTLLSTLATKWLTNQEHMREMKAKQKELQKELKQCKAKGDSCRVEEINSEVVKITLTMMKSSLKPMYVTFIPFIILIYWIRGVYGVVEDFSWFWWYLGSAIVSSMIFRKLFKMA